MSTQGATRRSTTTAHLLLRERSAHRAARRSHRPAALWAIVLLVAAATIAAVAVAAVLTGAWEPTLWWLTNQAPPAVQATAPAGPQRGAITLPISIGPAARVDLEKVTLDGVPPPAGVLSLAGSDLAGAGSALDDWWSLVRAARTAPEGGRPDSGRALATVSSMSLDTTKLADGPHTLQLAARDRSRQRNRSATTLTVTTDNTPPALTLAAAARVPAGRPLLLRLGADEPAMLAARWGDDTLPLLPASPPDAKAPAALALVAVPVQTTSAGDVTVRLNGRDVAGNTAERTVTIGVDPVDLPRQVLEVPPNLAPLATGPVATAEAAQLAALTSTVRPERLWQRPFQTPVPPGVPRTTGFGDRRDYADGYVAYHAGYDLAVPLGAPVAASADGIVVFAGPLAQRGNCVVLDHGWGVYTVYGHLSRIDGQMGQSVTQGQTIGLVGTTGLSTGPHVHWEVRLRGLAVDPGSWLALSAQLTG